MTFKKPDNVSYTDMCIYIDENIYKKYDEDLVYKYLYLLAYMLAKKSHFFKHNDDYDKFALFVANKMFFRLTSSKPELEKIKSILNYMKRCIQPLRIDYQQSEYAQIVSKEKFPEELYNTFESQIMKITSSTDICDFSLVMNDIGKTCNRFLSTLPYRKNSAIWYNIYASVILTFLNQITVKERDKQYLDNLKSHNRLHDYHINNLYKQYEDEKAILVHLPEHYEPYIKVLVKQLKSIVAKDLTDILQTKFINDFTTIKYNKDINIEEVLYDV